MSRPDRRARLLAVALTSAAFVAGCASAPRAAPTWVPKPEYPAEAIPSPSLPAPNPPNANPGQPNQPQPSPNGPRRDPNVVATKLTAPTGIAVLPDGSALVGERTTGRIVRVQPEAGKPVPTVRTIPGLDASGDGGLLDLALSPTYAEDGLIFAYVTTPIDNRVIHFTLHGPITPVLTGIPKGRTGNIGRLAFDAAGDLLVGTGDAGQPALAADPNSLAGKVVRVDDIGQPASGNPRPTSPVLTTGHHQVNGLCIDSTTGAMYEAEAASTTTASAPSTARELRDEINHLTPGDNYGWPAKTGSSTSPAAVLPAKYQGAAGCAIESRTLYVTAMDGRVLLDADLGGAGSPSATGIGTFSVALDARYGRLRTVVAAPDGALWLTTSNKDGHGKPIAADERVVRIFVEGGGGSSPL